MKAGDIFYMNGYFEEDTTRGELEELLLDAIEHSLGMYETDRMSNGFTCDTLFRMMDELITTEEQLQKLTDFINEQNE